MLSYLLPPFDSPASSIDLCGQTEIRGTPTLRSNGPHQFVVPAAAASRPPATLRQRQTAAFQWKGFSTDELRRIVARGFGHRHKQGHGNPVGRASWLAGNSNPLEGYCLSLPQGCWRAGRGISRNNELVGGPGGRLTSFPCCPTAL